MNIRQLFFKEKDEERAAFQRNRNADLAKLLILLCAVSCFTHPFVARAVICVSAILFIILPSTRDKIFVHRGSFIILLFVLITSIVALCYANWLGFLCTLSFLAMMTVSFVARSIATKKFYEQLMDSIIIGGCIATLGSIIERIIHLDVPGYRCTVLYPNPNFFGVGVTLVVLVCAYKAVSRAKRTYLYYIAAIFNAVGIYLCGSMSLWIVAAIGIIILLTISHEYKLLAIFLGLGALVLITATLIPQFLPRINEMGDTTNNRITIWNFAIKHIKEKPIFGRGFFSYKYLYNLLSPTDPTIYKASLSHNIIIDSLLCHGIVGTALIFGYLVQYIRDIFACHTVLKTKNQGYTIIKFIVSVAAAIVCYGMIDTTVVWVQTGMIILFIAAGIGVEERKARHLKEKNS